MKEREKERERKIKKKQKTFNTKEIIPWFNIVFESDLAKST